MQTQTLEKVVAIHPEIRLWSGRKRLRREDLRKITGDQLPPEDLASLGSKRICNPKDVAVFERIKRRVERDCQEVGIRFLGGYAIPEDRMEELLKRIRLNETQFNVERSNFLARYQQAVSDWITAHPQWGDVIQRSVSPQSDVERQLRFDYQVFRVQPADEWQPSGDPTSLQRKADTLPGRLFAEVSSEANNALEQTFKGRNRVTRRALRPIKRIRDKLDGLSFLDVRVSPIVDWIDEILADLPKGGAIEGRALNDLESAMHTLADSDRLKAMGQSRLSPDQVDSDDEDEADSEDDAHLSPEEIARLKEHGTIDAESVPDSADSAVQGDADLSDAVVSEVVAVPVSVETDAETSESEDDNQDEDADEELETVTEEADDPWFF